MARHARSKVTGLISYALRVIRAALARTQPREGETGRFAERGPWWNDMVGYRPLGRGVRNRHAEDYGTVFVQLRHKRTPHRERPKDEPLFDVFIGAVEYLFPVLEGERVVAFSVKDSGTDEASEALAERPIGLVPKDYVASTGYPIGGPWECFAFEVYSPYRSHPVPRKVRRAIESAASGVPRSPTRGPSARMCQAEANPDGTWR